MISKTKSGIAIIRALSKAFKNLGPLAEPKGFPSLREQSKWGHHAPIKELFAALMKGDMSRREFLGRAGKIGHETNLQRKFAESAIDVKVQQKNAINFLTSDKTVKATKILKKAQKKPVPFLKGALSKHIYKLEKRLNKDSKLYNKARKEWEHSVIGNFIDGSMSKRELTQLVKDVGATSKSDSIKDMLKSFRRGMIDMNTGNNYGLDIDSKVPMHLFGGDKFIPGSKIIKKAEAIRKKYLSKKEIPKDFTKKLTKNIDIAQHGYPDPYDFRHGLDMMKNKAGKTIKEMKPDEKYFHLRERLHKEYGHDIGTGSYLHKVFPTPSGAIKNMDSYQAYGSWGQKDFHMGENMTGMLKYLKDLKETVKRNPLIEAFKEGYYGK